MDTITKPTVALFAGSFHPFHIGHLNIVEKAERIFGIGNVRICLGLNPEKMDNIDYITTIETRCQELRDKLDKPVETYEGFLHSHIEKWEAKGYNVVLVRGLRNGDDLDYERNQLRFIDDFKKDVNTAFVVCDGEFEHISSTAIRTLKKFAGADVVVQYLP